MTTNSSSTPAVNAPSSAPTGSAPSTAQPFQSASLYAGDLNPDVTEVKNILMLQFG